MENDWCTKQRTDVKCTYQYTDLEDDQCDGKGTGEMTRFSSEFDLCQARASMYTEEGSNETHHDLRTYQVVSLMALREIVSYRHHEVVEATTKQIITGVP